MSAYAYAVIPYKNETLFKPEEGEVSCYPQLPEVKNIKSEFTEPDSLELFKDFILINTCYRLSSFIRCEDGFCWLRAEIYKIAKALGALAPRQDRHAQRSPRPRGRRHPHGVPGHALARLSTFASTFFAA